MTKGDLIKALEPYPNDMDVFIQQTDGEFGLSLVIEVEKQEVLFTEGNGNPDTEAHDTVIIIKDF